MQLQQDNTRRRSSSAVSLFTAESDTRVNTTMGPATHLTRAMSTPFAASAMPKSPAKSPAVSPSKAVPLSPPQDAKLPPVHTTTPKTTPSKPQRTPNARPSPKVTPRKTNTPASTVRNDGSPNNMRNRQASGSVAGSPSIMLTSEDEPFWDGDDMTLEMVTDVNDCEVDEDVSLRFSVFTEGKLTWRR